MHHLYEWYDAENLIALTYVYELNLTRLTIMMMLKEYRNE